MLEYEYRKHFGLSYEELMNEPYEVYLLNWAIIQGKNHNEAREQRAMERMRNMNG